MKILLLNTPMKVHLIAPLGIQCFTRIQLYKKGTWLLDSLVPHPYAKKIPFLFWLFDHCRKMHLWASNLVAIHAVKQSGLEYPLFYALWDNTRTKFELSLEMLKDLRAALPEKPSCG
ncbi:MAG TPA: hypothetical protein DCW46_10620 [Desulfotomaculum sp.]|nr:hypothetical protein [Desulfotomaculum sp.]